MELKFATHTRHSSRTVGRDPIAGASLGIPRVCGERSTIDLRRKPACHRPNQGQDECRPCLSRCRVSAYRPSDVKTPADAPTPRPIE